MNREEALPRLVIIRPQPGADRTAALARDAGFDPLLCPLFRIRPIYWDASPAADYDALLIASANVFRHGGDRLIDYRHLPVHAVGEETAKAAQAAGFAIASTGNGGAAALLPHIRKAGHMRILRPAGRDHVILDDVGLSMDTVITYESCAIEPEHPGILKFPAIIALHSARAAQHWRTICDRLNLDKTAISLAAFAPAIAHAAGGGWRAMAVAHAPNDRSLLSAAQTLVTSHQTG